MLHANKVVKARMSTSIEIPRVGCEEEGDGDDIERIVRDLRPKAWYFQVKRLFPRYKA